MSYYLFEVPSVSGHHTDLVLADPDNPNAPAYSHYAFTIGTPANPNELTQRRGIPFSSFRDWEKLSSNFNIEEMLIPKKAYLPGGSVLGEKDLNPAFQANTAMRLGALELLANISSGRITASDKDPFPHQLALQQYMKAHQTQVQRLLIADEVGLGKTIEVGLILRDLLVAQVDSKLLRCLYLTKGGLLDDVRLKLQSVIPGVDGESIVQVEKSFVEYGNRTDGIHIASMDAARRYVKKAQKKKLPTGVSPEILIIDEAHHCASEDELTSPQRIGLKATTRAYEAAYQMITGEFWHDSAPPKLVIFMSATPFRSRPQFINLLRLLTNKTSEIENAYSPKLTDRELVQVLGSDNSSTAVIWRQHYNVRSWSDKRLFPNLAIERPPLQASEAYLKLIEDIREKIKEIYSNYGESFGGFAIRQLETRLTSTTITGAMWLFRWCVRHQEWKTQDEYRQDISESTANLRKLIKGISQKLAAYDERNKSGHVTVSFPSDDFSFDAKSLGQPLPGNKIVDIYRLNEKLRRGDDEDNTFVATHEEITELTEFALELLNFADFHSEDETGAENAKLTWLKDILAKHPESKFLVFTESLQTCEIIIKALPRESEKLTGDMSLAQREEAVAKLRDVNSPVRVLVATSAADEGFDFQVANRVIHWDLSPNPAVLMQRNGRVARLGQILDVIAYYLIIAGTHEQRREQALVDRFTQLGITDERMRLKILGSLSIEQEEKIFQDIEEEKFSLIDDILKQAEADQKDMEEKLGELQTQLTQQWVISREELAKRLDRWMELGLPGVDQKYELTFSTKEWSRPVFRDEGTAMETAQAKIATIQGRKFTFDPEFKVFGREKENILLAGLYPWFKNEREGVIEHRPLPRNADPIGYLACSLARQRKADFTTISANQLYEQFPNLRDAHYLLFATHPLREVENHALASTDSYLTFYAFSSDLSKSIEAQGASAKEVYQMISLLEKDALKTGSTLIETGVLEAAKSASQELAKWLEQSRKLGGLTKKSYFLPIPVALVAVLQ
ncbi:MAG: DEAD/DEAH box helicase [Symplocastrum torsivum CPER-KK1]|jgi:superfamily II DNA or RNA helicase|uniref:DEAD/DEAH box helicase n=1 Tax=Symplocastrum torsivum CPER-KK1 TaxID=450513 RepID=A0A951UBB9_9CYAN|nr:DEAD/DEAH box helicase [Symplocastrum torsivum CPER-KK1]